MTLALQPRRPMRPFSGRGSSGCGQKVGTETTEVLKHADKGQMRRTAPCTVEIWEVYLSCRPQQKQQRLSVQGCQTCINYIDATPGDLSGVRTLHPVLFTFPSLGIQVLRGKFSKGVS